MTEYKRALTKYVRISPSKARPVARMIRGLNAEDAMMQLRYCPKKGARLLRKTLQSAIANAETQNEWKKEQMKVREVRVDEGPTMKRAKPRNRGGRAPIMKRTSHLLVVLSCE